MKPPDFRLNRIFSSPLAALLLKTPLTPNQVTLLSLFSGLSAGWLFSLGDGGLSFLAALFYVLAALLDNCDGEIARAKHLTSVFGGWFDVGSDLLVDLALFTGIALGLLGRGYDAAVYLFLTLCLTGALAHGALVILEKLRGFGPAVYANPNAGRRAGFELFNILDALREGDACWLVLAFAVAGRADWLLWTGGIYMQALWITAFLLNKRLLFARK